METVIQKFGGTSVADADCIRRVAQRILKTREQGKSVVGVVSAQGHTTDTLLRQARELCPHPPVRELDMLLSAGERISMALLAMALHSLGAPVISYTGAQAGILTDQSHTRAKIVEIRSQRIEKALSQGKIVLVAGFQGASTHDEETTLGRGGSDTTAVALAVALKAAYCEIFTDVDGVYTADPRMVPGARKLLRLSYEEMLELAAGGAGVLQLRSVEFAQRYNVAVHVRSSFHEAQGTWIVKEESTEHPVISGISATDKEAKLVVGGVPDRPGIASTLFEALARENINVDMIVQSLSERGATDISFTVDHEDVEKALSVLGEVAPALNAAGYRSGGAMGKVSVVGAGMRTHPGVAAKVFTTLAQAGINIEMISTSSIKISCVVPKEQVASAVRALHSAFNLEEAPKDSA